MKLFITRTSPYGRVARAVALELDLPVEFVVVAVRDAVDELLDYNPAAKVPSLQLDSGMVLSESRLICEYLESIQKSPLPIRLLASLNDEAGRHWEGLITGFLDGISVWVRELRRVPDEQSPAIRALEHRRALRCLAHFELAWSHETQAITYASIMLATTLQLIDMRAPLEWRTRPAQAGRVGRRIRKNTQHAADCGANRLSDSSGCPWFWTIRRKNCCNRVL